MSIEEILTQSGFDEKEARIYLALLELGMEKVQAIAKRAGIKRPTAYVLLESLYAKNFIIKTYKDKKIYYAAEKPDIILRALKDREERFAGIMPLLAARMSTRSSRPKIKIYDGHDGLEQVYDEIYTSATADFLGAMKDVLSIFPDFTEKFTRIIKSRSIFVRDLLADDPKDIDFALAAKGQNYEGRVQPKNLHIEMDCVVFDNKVAILSITEDPFAVVIESRTVARSFKSMFDVLWPLSTPLEEFLKQKQSN